MSAATYHASCGGPLLRLKVDSLVLAAFRALLLDARQLNATGTVSELAQERASNRTKRKGAHDESSSMSSSS
jgi:hypothetical protein